MSMRHVLSCALAALSLPSFAQQTEERPPAPQQAEERLSAPEEAQKRRSAPEVDVGLPLWEAGIIGGAVSTPAYPGSSGRSSRLLALPFFIYRGKVLRTDAGGLGTRLLSSDRLELDVGVALALPAHSDKDSVRAGMPNLGFRLEAGPRLKLKLWQIDPFTGLRLETQARTVVSTAGGWKHRGYSFEPKLGIGTYLPSLHTGLDASIGALYGDAKLNRYLYDVAPEYALPTRPAYTARGGLILLRTGLSATYRPVQGVRVYTFLRYESYKKSANRDSPLLTAGSGTSAGFGVAWTLGRSSTTSTRHPGLLDPTD